MFPKSAQKCPRSPSLVSPKPPRNAGDFSQWGFRDTPKASQWLSVVPQKSFESPTTAPQKSLRTPLGIPLNSSRTLSVVVQKADYWARRGHLAPSASTGPCDWALTARLQCQSLGLGLFGSSLVLVTLLSGLALDGSIPRPGVAIFSAVHLGSERHLALILYGDFSFERRSKRAISQRAPWARPPLPH